MPLMALLMGCACSDEDALSPVLTVEGGQIQGVRAECPDVYVFKGIPYAAAPIGDLRWREPQPVEAWDSIKVCDKFGLQATSPYTILASIPLSGVMAMRLPTVRTACT